MGNLEPYMDVVFIKSLFSEEPELREVKVKREGYCFLEFSSHDAAARVLDRYNGKPIPSARAYASVKSSNAVYRLNWSTITKSNTAKSTSSSSYGSSDLSLYIGDLSQEISEQQIFKVFKEKFPSVKGVRIVKDSLTGVSKGYGFIRIGNEKEWKEALVTMQGYMIGYCPIRVSIAIPKRPNNTTEEEETAPVNDPIYNYYYNNYLYNYYYAYNYDPATASTTTQPTDNAYIASDSTKGPEATPMNVQRVQKPKKELDYNHLIKPYDPENDNIQFLSRKGNHYLKEGTVGTRRNYSLSIFDIS